MSRPRWAAHDELVMMPARDEFGHIVPGLQRLHSRLRFGLAGGPQFEAPAGFMSDLASFPRLTALLCGDKLGRHQRAAVCHDWLCVTRPVGSIAAAEAFEDIMAADGVAWWRRWAMAQAVKQFGPQFGDDSPAA
jgi:hypothetical protein